LIDTPKRGLHIDASSGMAGDMFLASLIDCGLDLDLLCGELSKLPLSNFRIDTTQVMRGALRAVLAKVFVDTGIGGEVVEGRHQPHQHHHRHGRDHHHDHDHDEDHVQDHSHGHGRHYREIVEIIQQAQFAPSIEARALAIFQEIAEAESKVHGTTLDDVHFHEVGAVDSIVDICAAAVGIELLGIEKITCSPIGIGSGVRNMAHGHVPIPAPATAEIICGLPVRQTKVNDELLTPTGAAILKVIVDEFEPQNDLVFEAVGYGAGSADRADPPNVVRCQLFRYASKSSQEICDETVVVLETQVDDCSGETMGHARQLLEDAGALDVLVQSVQMKKNRPGFLLTVIAKPESVVDLQRIILTQTSSFGVRRHVCARRILERHVVTVNTAIGGARVKLGIFEGQVVQASPEHVDCVRLSKASGFSLAEVMRMVEASFRQSR
jgi:uncharacterized protein (TIGR00299 family) protein